MHLLGLFDFLDLARHFLTRNLLLLFLHKFLYLVLLEHYICRRRLLLFICRLTIISLQARWQLGTRLFQVIINNVIRTTREVLHCQTCVVEKHLPLRLRDSKHRHTLIRVMCHILLITLQ